MRVVSKPNHLIENAMPVIMIDMLTCVECEPADLWSGHKVNVRPLGPDFVIMKRYLWTLGNRLAFPQWEARYMWDDE